MKALPRTCNHADLSGLWVTASAVTYHHARSALPLAVSFPRASTFHSRLLVSLSLLVAVPCESFEPLRDAPRRIELQDRFLCCGGVCSAVWIFRLAGGGCRRGIFSRLRLHRTHSCVSFRVRPADFSAPMPEKKCEPYFVLVRQHFYYPSRNSGSPQRAVRPPILLRASSAFSHSPADKDRSVFGTAVSSPPLTL